MRFTGELRKILRGDTDRAARLIPRARTLMGRLLAFSGHVPTNAWRVPLEDGVVITLRYFYGQYIADIFVPGDAGTLTGGQLFLESGLIDYHKDYFPLEDIEKRPGELYYNTDIIDRLAEETPYQDWIRCDARNADVRGYTPGMRSLSINGVTQEELDNETVPGNLALMAAKKFTLASGQVSRLSKSARLLAYALMGTQDRGVGIDAGFLGARWQGVLLGATTASTAIVAWNGATPWLIHLETGAAWYYEIRLTECGIALLTNDDLSQNDIIQRRAYALTRAQLITDSRTQCGTFEIFGTAIADGWASNTDGLEASIVTLQVDEQEDSGGIEYIKNYRHRLYTATVTFDADGIPAVDVVETENKQGFVRDMIWVPDYLLNKTQEKNLRGTTINPFLDFGSDLAMWCYYDTEDRLCILRYDAETLAGPGVEGVQNPQDFNDFAVCGVGTRTDSRIVYDGSGFTRRGFYVENSEGIIVDQRDDRWIGSATIQTISVGSADPDADPDDFEEPVPSTSGGPTDLGTLRAQTNPTFAITAPRFCGLGGDPGSFSNSGTLNIEDLPPTTPGGANSRWFYGHTSVIASARRDAFIGGRVFHTTLIFPHGASDAVYIVKYAGLDGTTTRTLGVGTVYTFSLYEGRTSDIGGVPNGMTQGYTRKQAFATIQGNKTVTQETLLDTKPTVKVAHIGEAITTENGPVKTLGLSTWISWIQPTPDLLLRDEVFTAHPTARTGDLIYSQTFNSTYPWPKRLVTDDWLGTPAEQDAVQTGFLGWVGHV